MLLEHQSRVNIQSHLCSRLVIGTHYLKVGETCVYSQLAVHSKEFTVLRLLHLGQPSLPV